MSVVEQLLLEVELGEEDRERLCDLHERLAPQLAEIARRFLERLAARRDAAARRTTDPDPNEHTAQLRDTLVAWMASGLVGPHDERFHDSRARVGGWHIAAGLPPRHLVTAMTMLRCEYHDCIDQLYEPSAARRMAKSVDKLLDVELALMLPHLDGDADLVAHERDAQSDRIAAIQTLSAGLAHEVRNPLNSARLQLELLERRLRRTAADPKLIQPVEQVNLEIERLTRLLNEFLAFARPSELVLADHDVQAIVCDVVAVQRPF